MAICCAHRKQRGCKRLSKQNIGPNPLFEINGRTIEYVNEWPHLGHIISSNLNDEADSMQRPNIMAGQINNVLCYFGKLDNFDKLNWWLRIVIVCMEVFCRISAILALNPSAQHSVGVCDAYLVCHSMHTVRCCLFYRLVCQFLMN